MTPPPWKTALTANEARVLATLMEKARTVPDSYPLTLNGLQSGCNQKSARDPVMELGEHEIAEALDGLRERSLVIESSGGRVTRYEHNFNRVVGVPDQAAALLGLLMLRGPQTAGELRLNTERWHKFLDIGSVEAFLEELQDRTEDKGGPLVLKLPRLPGAREPRWAHLLCGPVDPGAATAALPARHETPALLDRIEALEAQVRRLQARLDRLAPETEADVAEP
jgi:uncharacterized protein YceH (UPF0502 family)